MATRRAGQLEALVDEIYVAALDPGAWPALLGRLIWALQSATIGLVTFQWESGAGQLVASAGLDPDAKLYEHYSPKNPFMPVIAPTIRVGDVAHSPQYPPDREFFKSEYFNDYMRPMRLHHNVVLCLARDSREGMFVCDVRELGRAPFAARDLGLARKLVPHLRRAMSIHRHLAAVEAERAMAADVLDQLHLGVFVLDSAGRPLLLNRSAREIADARDGLVLERDGLTTARRHETGALARAIGEAARSEARADMRCA